MEKNMKLRRKQYHLLLMVSLNCGNCTFPPSKSYRVYGSQSLDGFPDPQLPSQLMEALANLEEDEIPDDGALVGSGDDYGV
ncbi:hypothetical protein C8J56DRAFT_1065809 [Mycena floridula]|nr:hypothetical protein C8J56DRAFT_1065809 [Mycena floridula]